MVEAVDAMIRDVAEVQDYLQLWGTGGWVNSISATIIPVCLCGLPTPSLSHHQAHVELRCRQQNPLYFTCWLPHIRTNTRCSQGLSRQNCVSKVLTSWRSTWSPGCDLEQGIKEQSCSPGQVDGTVKGQPPPSGLPPRIFNHTLDVAHIWPQCVGMYHRQGDALPQQPLGLHIPPHVCSQS